MRVGVRCDLVAGGDHASDEVRPGESGIVDFTAVLSCARHEEGRRYVGRG